MTANAINLESEEANRGWVFYDGECPLCIASAKKFTPLLKRHGFNLAPLQTPRAQKLLGLKPGEPLTEMKLLTTNEKAFSGANAILQIARKIWWAWPLFAVSFLPGVKNLLNAIYSRVAASRTCFGSKCSTFKTIIINQPNQKLTKTKLNYEY